MHVHLEVDGYGHGSLPDDLTEASAKYFKAEDRTPSLDRIAEVYRELNMAAVVFTVDARTQLEHEPNSIQDLIAGAARNNDVLIPFGSVDPRTGAERDRRGQAPGRSSSACAASSSTRRCRASTPRTSSSTRCGKRCRSWACRASSTPARTAWAPVCPAGYGIKLAYSNPLLLDAVAADFPGLQIIMAHPSVPWQDEANSIATHKANVFIDLSGWSPEVLPGVAGADCPTRCLQDKVLFGTDFPLITPQKWLGAFADLPLEGRGPSEDPQGQRRPAARAGWLSERADRRAETAAATARSGSYSVARLVRRRSAAHRRRAQRAGPAAAASWTRRSSPLLAEYWERGEFPEQLARPLDRPGPDGTGGADRRAGASARRGIYQGFRIFELARTDASLATWYTAQAGLFRTAIRVGGSEEQQAEWMPKVIDFSLKGVFSLTEPEHGSDIAGGLATTARFEQARAADGDAGSSTAPSAGSAAPSTADVLAVFARDVADGQVKASSWTATPRA